MVDSSPPVAEATATIEPPPGRLGRYLRAQLEVLHIRLLLAQMVMRLIPVGLMGNVRAKVYRLAGFSHIADKVYIFGCLDLRGPDSIYENLEIGAYSEINSPCFLDLYAPVRIGTGVSIGHHAVIVTSNHFVGPPERRCGDRNARSVTISDGA
jgi:acetyltransferase-like isoleucine patch superfamily enzyme